MSCEIIKYIKDNYNVEIRHIVDDGTTWYVAADVLKFFGYKNVSKTTNCKSYNVRKYKFQSNGGAQKYLCIDYPSLVHLVLTAKKKEFGELQKWLIFNMSSKQSA